MRFGRYVLIGACVLAFPGWARAHHSFAAEFDRNAVVELKGVVMSIDKDDMRAVYGEGPTGKDVLTGKTPGPTTVKAFPTTLGRYSAVKGR